MRPGNKGKAVIMVERFRDVLPEGVSCTTGGYSPSTTVIGVGPQQIAHRAFVGDLLHSVNGADVVQGVDRG